MIDTYLSAAYLLTLQACQTIAEHAEHLSLIVQSEQNALRHLLEGQGRSLLHCHAASHVVAVLVSS